MMVGDRSEIDPRMRILVAGAAGHARPGRGRRRAAPRPRGRRRSTAHELDITDPAAIDEAIAELPSPRRSINCAAWSNVDGAEDDERGAMAINDTGAALLAAGAAADRRQRSSTPPATTSSTGPRRTPYLEDDMPAPIGAYGRSKLGGEVSVAAANPRHFIVRTSWLFGLGGKNFVETMLRIGDEQERCSSSAISAAARRAAPTSPRRWLQLIETDGYGIHHIVGGGQCTWFDFAPGDLRPGRDWRPG